MIEYGENTGVEKIRLTSKDIVLDNVDKIGNIFPQVITETMDSEGNLKRSIDFDKLKDILSQDIVEGKETYDFTWVGKRDAIAEAGRPTTKTLRPDLEESVDFENTDNVFISGDNLEVLKILQESYLKKIDVIYIDPPYNTGSDFVYTDDFRMNQEEFDSLTKSINETGERLVKNEKSNPRYHSDWLNMMYPRLLLAKNLLKNTGVIFISIDDNEVNNLKNIMNEIFGEENFIAQIVIDATPKNDPLLIATSHEYCLVYCKSRDQAKSVKFGAPHPLNNELRELVHGLNFSEAQTKLREYYKTNKLEDDNISNYKFVDERGIYRTGPLDDPQSGGPKDLRKNPLTGGYLKVPTRGWSCNLETWNSWVKEGLIEFPKNDNLLASKKTYLTSDKLEVGRSVLKMQTRSSTNYLKKLFNNLEVFSFPKPLDLIKEFLQLMNNKNVLVLDFFAGSSTTAEAVMQLNKEDDGNRKFIMVQLQEDLKENLKKAKKKKQKKIIENAISYLESIGKQAYLDKLSIQRILLAQENMQMEKNLKVFKLSDSLFEDRMISPVEYKQETLFHSIDNLKGNINNLDLVYYIMLSWGMELSLKISEENYNGSTIYNIDNNSLIACFDDNITEETIREIAGKEPLRAVFKDSSFDRSASKINLLQIFKEISPLTKVKVI